MIVGFDSDNEAAPKACTESCGGLGKGGSLMGLMEGLPLPRCHPGTVQHPQRATDAAVSTVWALDVALEGQRGLLGLQLTYGVQNMAR